MGRREPGDRNERFRSHRQGMIGPDEKSKLQRQRRPRRGAFAGWDEPDQPFFLTKASMNSTRVLTLSTVTAL